MPRWRTMIAPAWTAWPSPAFMPSRWPTLSRPFFEVPPAFLCAIDRSPRYFCVFFAVASLAGLAFLAVVLGLSAVPVVSALAARLEVFVAGLEASALALAVAREVRLGV